MAQDVREEGGGAGIGQLQVLAAAISLSDRKKVIREPIDEHYTSVEELPVFVVTVEYSGPLSTARAVYVMAYYRHGGTSGNLVFPYARIVVGEGDPVGEVVSGQEQWSRAYCTDRACRMAFAARVPFDGSEVWASVAFYRGEAEPEEKASEWARTNYVVSPARRSWIEVVSPPLYPIYRINLTNISISRAEGLAFRDANCYSMSGGYWTIGTDDSTIIAYEVIVGGTVVDRGEVPARSLVPRTICFWRDGEYEVTLRARSRDYQTDWSSARARAIVALPPRPQPLRMDRWLWDQQRWAARPLPPGMARPGEV